MVKGEQIGRKNWFRMSIFLSQDISRMERAVLEVRGDEPKATNLWSRALVSAAEVVSATGKRQWLTNP